MNLPCDDFLEPEFARSLDSMGFSGTQKRLWIKQFRKNQKKTCERYFLKLDNMLHGENFWEAAKKTIEVSRKLEPEEEPVPIIKDWEYFYRINNYSWGDAMYDWEEFNLGI
jgi:hypothetical protein